MSSSRPPMVDLDITIISAKHLKNVNWRDGDLIPSVVLSLSPSIRASTRPDTSGSTRPVWNERFLLPLPHFPPPPHTLCLKIVHDHESEDPEEIGSVGVPIPDPVEDPARIRTFTLLRPSGRPHGKIRLKLALVLRPLPPPISHMAPPVSNNYNPATVYPPLVFNSYTSATAPAYPPPPPGMQNYHSAPPVSNCYTSATAPARAPACSSVPGRPPPVVQNYNSAPQGFNSYNSAATAPAGPRVPGPPSPQQFGMMRPPVVQNYNFNPPVSNNYTSATAPAFPRVPGGLRPPQQSMPPPPPPPQVKNYNFYFLGSDDNNSAHAPTCPPFPRPPPLQQSFPPPPRAQDYNFTPPSSNNYNCAPACPPVPGPPPPQQSYPPPRGQYYNITSMGSNNYNSATAPPQKSYGCKNSYNDPYNGDKNNGSGSFGAGLVGAMRGLALDEEEESDSESTVDYSDYSESYIAQQPSAPVDDSVVVDRNRMMRGSEKVEHKAGSKVSNVGLRYDYSAYRVSNGYN